MKLSVHDILRRVAPYFAERASQFALKPAHPHRLILDRPEPIADCHARLLAIYKGSIFSNIDAIAEFTSDIIVAAAGNLPKKPSTAIVKAMVAWVHSLLIDNDLWFTFPTFDEALSRDQNYVMPLRRKLQEIEPILVHQAQIVETFVRIATDTLAAIADNYLPDAAFSEETGPATFTVPLLTLLKRPREFVEQTYATFANQHQYNTTEPYSLAFWNTRNRIYDNMFAASGMTLEQANKNPHKMVLPSDSDLDIGELAATYLAGTPFIELLQTPVPFKLTARFSHHHIVATPGAGKTNLIGVLLSKDFDEVERGRASVIVLDSQGDLIRSIVRCKDFAPGGRLHDRLVYVDPTDIEYPLELNFFARRGDRALTPLEKRTEHSDLVDLLLFLFGALKQEATGRQETLIKAVASLIQEIPDATLMTLNAIFEPADRKKSALAQFEPYLARLDPAVRDFFAVDFNSQEFSQSRAQMRARVQSFITDPVFRAMFSATSQKLDFAHEMNSGKVILINAYEDLLKTSTEVFGRFFIALAGQAAQARQNIPEERRMPTYLYIDECYKFIKADTNVETILDTGRKYRLGIIIAHQRLNQLSDALKSAASSAAIKMVRSPIHEDVKTLAYQLNTTSEYLDDLPEHAFATRITGMSRPVALTMPLSPLATAEQMSDEEFAAVRRVMRHKYARSESTLHNTEPAGHSSPPPVAGSQSEAALTIIGLDANGRVDKALRLLASVLKPLIEKELRSVHGDDWEQHVSFAAGAGPNPPFDSYAALKTMLDNWQTCFKDSLTLKTRTNVSKALEGRNTIYHAEDEIPVPDAISYLTAVRDIAIAVSADVVADTVRAFIDDQLRHATTPKTHEASRAAHDGGQQYTASSPASRAPPAPEKLAEPANAADPLVKPSRKWDCRGI